MMRSLMRSLLPSVALAAAGLLPLAQPHASAQTRRTVVQRTTQIPRDASLATPPEGSLSFTAYGDTWEDRQEAPLFGDGVVKVSTQVGRFPRCGIAGTVTAFIQPDNGPVIELPLREGDEYFRRGSFRMPRGARSAQLWFRSVNGACTEWDSNFARNYTFEVQNWAPTLVWFDAAWNENVAGTLRPGTTLVVDFDLARLPECRGTYRGYEAWDVSGLVLFDTGLQTDQTLVKHGWGVPSVAMRGVYPIPASARSLQAWFRNSSYFGCTRWDSNYGFNYRFPVVP